MCDTDGCGGGHEWIVNENDEDQEGRKMDKYKKLKNNPKSRVRCQKPINFAGMERTERWQMARWRRPDELGGKLAALQTQPLNTRQRMG